MTESEKLKMIIETIDTDGWKILADEFMQISNSYKEQNDMFPMSHDESNYIRGKIKGISEVLGLVENYKKEHKETQK